MAPDMGEKVAIRQTENFRRDQIHLTSRRDTQPEKDLATEIQRILCLSNLDSMRLICHKGGVTNAIQGRRISRFWIAI